MDLPERLCELKWNTGFVPLLVRAGTRSDERRYACRHKFSDPCDDVVSLDKPQLTTSNASPKTSRRGQTMRSYEAVEIMTV